MGWLSLIPSLYRWIALAVLLASLVGGYFAWEHHQQGIGEARANALWETAIAKQKQEAATLLQTETNKVRVIELELAALRSSQEQTDAINSQAIFTLNNELRRKSRAAGGPGLRDPNAAGCRSGSGSPQSAVVAGPVNSPANGTEAPGLLSEPLEKLLLDDYATADDINAAYISCRQDAMNIRGIVPQ